MRRRGPAVRGECNPDLGLGQYCEQSIPIAGRIGYGVLERRRAGGDARNRLSYGVCDFRTLQILHSYSGGRQLFISMVEGRSFGGAAEGAKLAAKAVHFHEK